jgi:hypothetical protein
MFLLSQRILPAMDASSSIVAVTINFAIVMHSDFKRD